MSAPYATVILPTYDRASTLPFALQSAQAQTVREIEILIVLDGASRQCRNIAIAAANRDSRVRILEFQRSPGSRERSAHAAVHAAAAPRICYIDDDDLILTHHVETLGALLDDSDIADTRVASVGRNFDLHLAPCPGANVIIRKLLAGHRHKTLFDTHIAHWVGAYDRFARWAPAEGGSAFPVWEFFKGFAKAPDCRWRSGPAVTGLSLHGANRRDMSGRARKAEIRRWAREMARDPGLSAAIEKADSAHHLLRMLFNDPPGSETFETYLNSRDAFDDVYGGAAARHVYCIFSGCKIDEDAAIALAVRFGAPAFVGYRYEAIVKKFASCFGAEECEGILQRAAFAGRRGSAGAIAAYAFYLSK